MAKNEYHIMAARLADFAMAPLDVTREFYRIQRRLGHSSLSAVVSTAGAQAAMLATAAAPGLGVLAGVTQAHAGSPPLAGVFSATAITGLGYAAANRLAGAMMPTVTSGPRERAARREERHHG